MADEPGAVHFCAHCAAPFERTQLNIFKWQGRRKAVTRKDTSRTNQTIDHDRRRLFGSAALTFAAAELGVVGAALAEAKPAP
jgi:hypothetical protein